MYKIIEAISKHTLETEVNEHLNNGYHLVGGVSITYDGNSLIYAQAVEKCEYQIPIELEQYERQYSSVN